MRSPRASTSVTTRTMPTSTPMSTPMSAGPETTTFRPATVADAEALTTLERDTNLVALAHVFPGVAYPSAEVRERWLSLIADPTVRVEVVGTPGRLDVYLASDDERLRHLGVRPELWGR